MTSAVSRWFFLALGLGACASFANTPEQDLAYDRWAPVLPSVRHAPVGLGRRADRVLLHQPRRRAGRRPVPQRCRPHRAVASAARGFPAPGRAVTESLFRVAVSSCSSNELPQSRHLGERGRHGLGRAGDRYPNLRRCDHDATCLERSELEHRCGDRQPRVTKHGPVLRGSTGEIAKWSLTMVQTHGDMADDQFLQRATQLWQALRLRDQVILEALSAQPFAFLEDNGTNGILPLHPTSTLHDHVELITRHADDRRLRTAASPRHCRR